MYPDIVVNGEGNGYMTFSLSGRHEVPELGRHGLQRATSGPTDRCRSPASGAAPEDGFTCYISGYGGCRWGDYSGGAVWNGQGVPWPEYIPPAGRDTYTNWGTFAWSLPTH